MTFTCKHCGQCCTDDCTQINLSLGDIARLCAFLKCDVAGLLDKIAWRPFEDPEKPGCFDVEIGLRLPCGFRSEGKCSAYDARPLNCRMFPSVFLGNVPDECLSQCIDPTHKCVVDGIKMSVDEKERYKAYSKFIGELILTEAEETEKFYGLLGLKKVVVACAEGDDSREGSRKRFYAAMKDVDEKIDFAALQRAVDGLDRVGVEDLNKREKDILIKKSKPDADE